MNNSGPSRARTGPVLRFLRFLGGLAVRLYSLALALLIGWVTWRAISFLLLALVVSPPAPPVVTELPRRLGGRELSSSRADWAGLERVEWARSPLSHYHRPPEWIVPDRANNCTTSGCHAPLPHARRREDRAFLNMHATVLHCGVCHFREERVPIPMTWYDLEHGRVTGPPPLLVADARLAALVEGGGTLERSALQESRRHMVQALEDAAVRMGNVPQLESWARHFAGVTPGGDAWNRLIQDTARAFPRYYRGSYGSKIALLDTTTGRPLLGHPGTEEAVAKFRKTRASLADSDRRRLLEKIHPLRRSEPRACGDCHGSEQKTLDFESLGYSPARKAAFRGPVIVQMIEHIIDGRPFHLPGFLEPDSGPP